MKSAIIEVTDVNRFIKNNLDAIKYIKNPSKNLLTLHFKNGGDFDELNIENLSEDLIILGLRNGSRWRTIKNPSESLIRKVLLDKTATKESGIINEIKHFLYKNEDILNSIVVEHYYDFQYSFIYRDLFNVISFDKIYEIMKLIKSQTRKNNNNFTFHLWRNNEIEAKVCFNGYNQSFKCNHKRFSSDDFNIILENEKSFKSFICYRMDMLLMFKSVPPIVQKYILEKYYDHKPFRYLITDPSLLKIITCRNILK
jgi:hypothetical protein